MGERIIITQPEMDQLDHLMFHAVTSQMQRDINAVHAFYVQVALNMIRTEPPSRTRTIALTALETGMLWAMHSIRQQGEVKLPPGFLLDPGDDPAENRAANDKEEPSQ